MSHSEKLAVVASIDAEPQPVEQPGENAAVHACTRAWQTAYNKAIAKTGDDYEAEKAALKAFRRAMPHLAGHDNIRDFIACVTYASLNEIIRHSDAEHYLEAAKIAIGAVRHEAKR